LVGRPRWGMPQRGETEQGCSTVLATQTIHSLPESLDWMVLFDLSTLRRLATVETVRAMYFLPRGMDLVLARVPDLLLRRALHLDHDADLAVDIFRTFHDAGPGLLVSEATRCSRGRPLPP
jgi:hypothetical protein